MTAQTLAAQFVIAIGLIAVLGPGVAAQNTLTAAKQLYVSAAYEEALVAFASVPASGEDAAEIEQYRALCLLALGRSDEAARAIEQIVRGRPLYQPSQNDASPRVRSVFQEVRKRTLPTLARELYASGKTSFERKELAEPRASSNRSS